MPSSNPTYKYGLYNALNLHYTPETSKIIFSGTIISGINFHILSTFAYNYGGRWTFRHIDPKFNTFGYK